MKIKSILILLIMLMTFNYGKTISEPYKGSMYFCKYYDVKSNKPVGISGILNRGTNAVIVKLNSRILLTRIKIQLDLYNENSKKYEYYYSYEFNVKPNYTYIYFNNIYFGLPGRYRVFLLDLNGNVLSIGLVEIK